MSCVNLITSCTQRFGRSNAIKPRNHRLRPVRLGIDTVRVLFIAIPSLYYLRCAAKKGDPYETQNPLDPLLPARAGSVELRTVNAVKSSRRRD